MLRPRDLLDRVRLSGAPGAAASGVPADRAARAAAELGPLLARLDPAQREAQRIRVEAEAEAERIRRRAAQEATGQVAAARALAEEWRRRAAAEAALETVNGTAVARQAADAEAAEVHARATERLPRYVDRVTALVLDLARGGDA